MSARRWPDSVPTLIDPERAVMLRAHQAMDLPRVIEQCTDPQFVRWTTAPHPFTRGHGEDFLRRSVPAQVDNGRAMLWAVEAPSCGFPSYCGTMEIRLLGDRRGEIAYALHPDARGRGLVSAAGRLAIDWAFDVAGLVVIEWQARTGNWASRYAAAALGFSDEGVRRRRLLQRGELFDCWTASLLAEDPRTSAAPLRQPELTGPDVRLRPVTEGDLGRILEACNDPQIRYWLPTLPDPYGPVHARRFVETCREEQFAGRAWTWAVTEPNHNSMLGVITLSGLLDAGGQGELGYWGHPAGRGRGMMGGAARVVADHALGTAGTRSSVVLRVAAGNIASQQVARRAGGVPVGVLPEGFRLADGTRTDLLLFARTANTG